MPTFTATVDASALIEDLHDLEKTQLPYALARTLTAVAKDAQKAVVANVRTAFTLRNSWTEQGIRIIPADKKGSDGTIQAAVYTNTANRSTGAPDYLGRQETGGEKVPFGGHQYLAIPTKYLRFLAGSGIIRPEWRPRALLGAVAGRFTSFNRRGQITLKRQRGSAGLTCFIQEMKDGDKAIMARYGSNHEAVPLYLLISEANVKKSGLEMQATVQRVADEQFAARWEEAWRNIRLKGIRL